LRRHGLGNSGTLHARVSMYRKRLTVQLRSESPLLIEALNEQTHALTTALKAEGLMVDRVVCLHGADTRPRRTSNAFTGFTRVSEHETNRLPSQLPCITAAAARRACWQKAAVQSPTYRQDRQRARRAIGGRCCIGQRLASLNLDARFLASCMWPWRRYWPLLGRWGKKL